MPDVAYYHLAELPWEDPRNTPANLKESVSKAQKVEQPEPGASLRRAPVTSGAIGMHSQISELPAGFQIPLHSHTAAELMIVLDGSCTVTDGPELVAGDVTEVPGDVEYGFTAGPNGIRFMVVRPDVSTTNFS